MAKEVKTENEAVVNAVSSIEQFFDTNKKLIWGIILAIVVIAGGSYLYYKFAYLPKKAEAQQQMYKAEAAFRDGNYELALNGDGNILGFKDIISDYGNKAGKAVYLYAAICEMQNSNFDEVLSYLAKYSTKDQILAGRAKALKGDVYCAKEDYAKAASCFEDAAKTSDDSFSAAYLLKAGQAYEALGKNDKALELYKEIKDKYLKSIEAYDIDKYITRLEVK